MKTLILSTIAAAGLALCASSAFAHGHLVTGPEVYATPADSQPVAPVVQERPAPHKTHAMRHVVHAPSENTAS